MPQCLHGAEPKPGQNPWFQFTVANLLEALGLIDFPYTAIGSWFTLNAIGIPAGPIYVRDF